MTLIISPTFHQKCIWQLGLYPNQNTLNLNKNIQYFFLHFLKEIQNQIHPKITKRFTESGVSSNKFS